MQTLHCLHSTLDIPHRLVIHHSLETQTVSDTLIPLPPHLLHHLPTPSLTFSFYRMTEPPNSSPRSRLIPPGAFNSSIQNSTPANGSKCTFPPTSSLPAFPPSHPHPNYPFMLNTPTTRAIFHHLVAKNTRDVQCLERATDLKRR